MTERTFRIFFGASLVLALYFDLRPLVLGLIGLLAFQGITNWRITHIISRLRHGHGEAVKAACAAATIITARINFEAERALHLIVAGMLIFTYVIYNQQLWFFPWFIGFALFGAGLSGICPMILVLKASGLK